MCVKTSLIAKSASTTLLALSLSLSAAVGKTPTVADEVASFDKLVGDYNLISFGDTTFKSYGDTEGMLAINGSLTIDGGSIATKATFASAKNYSSPPLYVTGSFNASNTVMLQNGYASLPGASKSLTWKSASENLDTSKGAVLLSEINSGSNNTSTSPKTKTDPRSSSLNPSWNFTSLHSQFETISSVLASSSTNGKISVVGQNLVFSPIVTGQHGAIIFDLDMNLLKGNLYNGQAFSNIQINIPDSTNYIINVLNANGKTLFGTNYGINFNVSSTSNYDRLLWNVVGSSGTVTFGNGGQFYGSILAADYEVKNSNTAINGQVVADGVCYSGAELHYTGFEDDIPQTPEASTYGVLGAAACLGLVALRRIRKS